MPAVLFFRAAINGVVKDGFEEPFSKLFRTLSEGQVDRGHDVLQSEPRLLGRDIERRLV